MDFMANLFKTSTIILIIPILIIPTTMGLRLYEPISGKFEQPSIYTINIDKYNLVGYGALTHK